LTPVATTIENAAADRESDCPRQCPIVAVNAFTPPEVNATSGVVGTDFQHLVALPRNRKAFQTVEFLPTVRT